MTTTQATTRVATLRAAAKDIQGKINVWTTVYKGALRSGDTTYAEQVNARLWLLQTDLQGIKGELEFATA